jgi:hypothetical protein
MRTLHFLAQPYLVDLRQAAALRALNWYHAHRLHFTGKPPELQAVGQTSSLSDR